MSQASKIATVTILHEGKQTTYRLRPKVEIKFEKTMKLPIAKIIENSHMYKLAWMAATDAGDVTDNFDQWVEGLDSVDLGEEEVTPLESTPSSGASLPSPSSPAQE